MLSPDPRKPVQWVPEGIWWPEGSPVTFTSSSPNLPPTPPRAEAGAALKLVPGGGKPAGLSLSLALGLWEEKPGGKADGVRVYPPAHWPACLLQGEEVQSVTNQVIFITAVSGRGKGGGKGEGAAEQPQRLALQTRTCLARGGQPGAGAGARARGSPAHRDPSLPPARPPPACSPAFQTRSKGAPLILPCLLLSLSCIYLGGSEEGGPRHHHP